MSRYRYLLLLVVIAACSIAFFLYKTSAPSPALSTSAAPQAEFGGVSLKIEYATTSEARERGLGGRTSLAGDYGMLFIFPEDGRYGFWMKDMLVPIDIFWLDSKGHVVSISADVSTSTYPNVFYPTRPARYVLETFAGFAREHNIQSGTSLVLKNFPIVSE